ncbi:DUF3307 domain-containing protein [Tropicibacter oceani]|uniref:DUF3307 domain-containing protein n=1 Tax=Tropicibacter oceani TaxID=3058420 RepID=A0ABY8QF54_9RHOB|nr:DUF3307 domain-containing protein [Tropicibacter oceani]WGW02628.1 DUF3307 domain-containing protein [Tropicibacter oceani]
MLALSAQITPAMLQSFAALLLAHCLADFTFQTRWMVDRKRNPLVLALHIALVFVFSTALLGGVWQVALVVSLAHFVIDGTKVWVLPASRRNTLGAFLGDQIAHLMTLIAAALWWPRAVAQGSWSAWADLALIPTLTLSGLILTVWAGGYAVGMLTARFRANPGQSDLTDTGLPDAGRLIGQLERALIFLLILVGEPAGVGFLIAAKSILRFDTKEGQYVIIGTLASVTWAMVLSYATLGLLEIAALTP